MSWFYEKSMTQGPPHAVLQEMGLWKDLAYSALHRPTWVLFCLSVFISAAANTCTDSLIFHPLKVVFEN